MCASYFFEGDHSDSLFSFHWYRRKRTGKAATVLNIFCANRENELFWAAGGAFYNQSVPETNNVVAAATTTPKLQDGVIAATEIAPIREPGCTVYVHYNGPTDQLRGICAGMATLDPGASPHPPHRHPEEEILIVAEGTGIIECDGKVTQVGPGAMMYCAGNTLHGITNTGTTQMTFYWSKWLAQGFSA
jgi:quercetin dioxygenase-like cupin family protein